MNAAAPEPKANMGKPEPRYDARLKVTGAARYPSDVPVSNPAYAFLVTSSIAKGRLERLDLDEARAVPGVLDILTQENTTELKSGKFGGGAATSIDKPSRRSISRRIGASARMPVTDGARRCNLAAPLLDQH